MVTEACCQSRRGRETSICSSRGKLPGGHLTLQGSPETKTLPAGADRKQRGRSPERGAARVGRPQEPPHLSSQAPGRLPRGGTSPLRHALVHPRGIQACRNGNCLLPTARGKPGLFPAFSPSSLQINPGAERWGEQTESLCSRDEASSVTHVPRQGAASNRSGEEHPDPTCPVGTVVSQQPRL